MGRSQLVSVDFSLTNSFRSHYGPGVDSASNSGSKGGRCVRLTTCAVVTKSGNLNFPEPSGTVQDCNWTALLLLSELYWNTASSTAILFN